MDGSGDLYVADCDEQSGAALGAGRDQRGDRRRRQRRRFGRQPTQRSMRRCGGRRRQRLRRRHREQPGAALGAGRDQRRDRGRRQRCRIGRQPTRPTRIGVAVDRTGRVYVARRAATPGCSVGHGRCAPHGAARCRVRRRGQQSGTTHLKVPVTLSQPVGSDGDGALDHLYLPGDSATRPTRPPTTPRPAGTVTFAPGETSATVTIPVNGDTLVEPDEYIVVSFHDPTNANMGGFWGLGLRRSSSTTTTPPSYPAAAPWPPRPRAPPTWPCRSPCPTRPPSRSRCSGPPCSCPATPTDP